MLSSGLLCMHAVTNTPAATDGTYFARTFHRHRPSPSAGRVGSCIGCFGACSVFTSHYGLHDSPSRLTTLYIRGSGSFVASAAAPIATGWSEPVPGRDFQPAVDHLLYTAHQQALAKLDMDDQPNRFVRASYAHSCRRAFNGSILVARRAGMNVAARATVSKTAGTNR